MKILMLITGLGMGGAEKVVTSLSDSLVARGHEVAIAFLTGKALVRPRNPHIRIVDLGLNSPLGVAKAYRRLRRLVVDFKPDVLHSHMVHANILARLLRLSLHVPRLISSAHSGNEGGRLRMCAYRVTDRLADLSTNVSDDAVQDFVQKKAVRRGRMVTAYNGISTEEFRFLPAARSEMRSELGLRPECQLVLAVGRFNEAKDYPTLLRALRSLQSRRPETHLAIAGDGPLRSAMVELARSLNIQDHVSFLGARSDIPRLMAAADVFVLSSAWEGFGLVVAEAMACERVVVATDSGGVKEVLSDTGFLVPVKDPQALANALEKALDLPPEQQRILGQRARRRVEGRYSLEAAVSRWLMLYAASPSAPTVPASNR